MEQIGLYDDDSSDSVKEMEPPKKLPPPLIDLTKDEIVFDVNPKSKNASQFIDKAFFTSNGAVNALREDNPSHWTDDMIKFYNDNWGGEAQFNVEKIQSKMDKNPSLWEVSPRDLHFMRNRKIRSHVKCWNCCQFGHTVYQCREELQIPKCHMCGGAGHVQKTCPCAICLTCGNQMAIFVLSCFKCIPETRNFCSRCCLHGHHFINCTDNWRRFHSTIGKTTVDVPRISIYKAQRELWCCNCAKKGHLQINCGTTRDLSFPDTFPYVASYETRFNQDIYSAVRQEPVASTSASQTRSRELPQPIESRLAECKWMRNLSKSNKKKRRKRKKKKKNKRSFIQIPDIIPL